MDVRKSCPLAFIALAASGVVCAGTAFVNFGSAAQTIEGFGASTAWLPQLSSAQANALFSNGNSQQMGLSILRVRIDPGGSGNWGTELANGQAARARGAKIIATPWTPPASMKSNGTIQVPPAGVSIFSA
jgi:glucuronoarabinoxylan endo-1,4-beta-xylanase